MTFYRNGESLGIAFQNFQHSTGIFPCMSFQGREEDGCGKELTIFLGGAGEIRYLPLGYRPVYAWVLDNAPVPSLAPALKCSIPKLDAGDTLVFRLYHGRDT